MRVPNESHTDLPWRIHGLVDDFTLEDVWEIPGIAGGAAAFDRLVELVTSSDPAHARDLPTRLLWGARDLLGKWFGLGRVSAPTAPGNPSSGMQSDGSTIVDRILPDLAGTARTVSFSCLPFSPLYKTTDEFAAELSNRTVHGIMHLGWMPADGVRYRVQMGVYVKPRGALGRAYMAFIKPFRYLIVYPAMERQFTREWKAGA